MTGYTRRIGLVIIWVMAWVWAIVAGVVGMALLVHQGPLPIAKNRCPADAAELCKRISARINSLGRQP